MKKFLLRWLFVIWFIVAAVVWHVSNGGHYDEGSFFVLGIITFILVLPTMIIGELHWIIGKFYIALYVFGGLFALSLDLLRLHIKKYRGYKRIALQAEKEKQTRS